MKTLFCFECQKEYIKKHGTVQLSHPDIGNFKVHNLLHMLCEKCGDVVILPEQAEYVFIAQTKLRIESFLNKTKEKFNSSSIADELQVEILIVEKSLIELLNEHKIASMDIKMRAGKRKFYSSKKAKSIWDKLKRTFE